MLSSLRLSPRSAIASTLELVVYQHCATPWEMFTRLRIHFLAVNPRVGAAEESILRLLWTLSTKYNTDEVMRLPTGSTANCGADKGYFGQTVVSDTHVANLRFYLVVGSDLEIQDTSEICFVSTSLRSHPRSVGPRVRPGTYEVPRPTRRQSRYQAVYDSVGTLAHI